MIRLGSETCVYLLELHYKQDTHIERYPKALSLPISHELHALCLLIPAYTLYMY